MPKFYDISPVISAHTAVWPGDLPFSRENNLSIAQGHNIDLSAIHTTVHIGAHADAPSHTGADEHSIEKVSLEPYWGLCQVVQVSLKDPLITVKELKGKVGEGSPQRILVGTGSFPDPNFFNEDFHAFDPETVDWLGKRGVRLIGIDTPSFDPFTSKTLPAHEMLRRHKIANLEGLILRDVPEGIYELSAIPLAIKDSDASPVRAVLRTTSQVEHRFC